MTVHASGCVHLKGKKIAEDDATIPGWKRVGFMTEQKKPSQAAEPATSQDKTPQPIDIPWFKRWEDKDKDKTPPDTDFIARLEELEYR